MNKEYYNFYSNLEDKVIMFRFGGRHTGLQYHNIKMYINKISKLDDIHKGKVLLCKESNYCIYEDLLRLNYPDICNYIKIIKTDDLPERIEGILIDKDKFENIGVLNNE